jgi:hypothetical protein
MKFLKLEVFMSRETLKLTVFLCLCAGIGALARHAFTLPHEAVATGRSPVLTFQGGSGDTPASAVLIAGAPDYIALVAGEYQYLGEQCGQQDHDWRVVKKEEYQQVGQVYDIITVELSHGAKRQIFFDITKYFKKP